MRCRLLMILAGALVASSIAGAQPAKAPDTYKVNLDTSKGAVVIEVHRDWAPNGADHFYDLVKSGFYDNARFFRTIKGFMVQFGIAGDPAVMAAHKGNIKDDPVKQSNKRGFVTYAMSGQPNSRSTQVFINYADNSGLDKQGFAPFGEVTSGMDVVDKFYGDYGEAAQHQFMRIITEGNAFLNQSFPKLDYIKKATIAK